MQLGFDVQIPDGLLAANALLAENSRQGFATGNRAPYQGLNRANCTAALGLSWSVASATCSTHLMGRFMSPDWSAKVAPVPYAKLDNPQSLNLYAYVGNNPLSRVDPDGHVTCSGSKDQCAQIKTGLDLAKAAQAKLGADSAGGKAIGKVLAFYGAWGKDNGVHVSFANLDKGTLGDEKAGPNGTTNIRFDLKQINAAAANSSSGGVFGMSERAGVEIHEGTHGVDDKVRGGGTDSRRALDATEHNAYRTESYVFQGLGVNSAQGLWSTNWTPDNMEANRSSAVDAAAAGSVAADCKGGGCKP